MVSCEEVSMKRVFVLVGCVESNARVWEEVKEDVEMVDESVIGDSWGVCEECGEKVVIWDVEEEVSDGE